MERALAMAFRLLDLGYLRIGSDTMAPRQHASAHGAYSDVMALLTWDIKSPFSS